MTEKGSGLNQSKSHHYKASTKNKEISLDFIYECKNQYVSFSIEVDSFTMLSECAEVCKKHNAHIDNGELDDELYDEKTGQCFGCDGVEVPTWCGNDFTNGYLSCSAYSTDKDSIESIKNQICDYILGHSDYFRFVKSNRGLINKLKAGDKV